MKTSLFFILSLLLSFTKVSIAGGSHQTPKQKKDSLAKAQIQLLKNGALLVRLQTKKNTIEALRKAGNDTWANKVEKEQKHYNNMIVKAFRREFSFCKVYFFYSDQSDNIRKKAWDKVLFLNDSLRPDNTIQFTATFFLTAEVGVVEADTVKNYSHSTYEPNANWSVKKEDHYYGGPSMGIGALIIKSDQFIQLRKPFPFYVRTFDGLPLKRKMTKVVAIMNKRLNSFEKKK